MKIFLSRGYNTPMSNKPVQLEIFEQDYKSRRNSLSDAHSDTAVHHSRFPIQTCVIVSCSIIVFISVFVLGIEKGKSLVRNNTSVAITKKTPEPDTNTIAPLPNTNKPLSPQEQTTPITPINKNLEKNEKSAIVSASKFVIQIATYKKDSSYVEKEIAKLKQKGFEAFVKKSGDYAIIYAGNFENKQKAQERLKELKKTYKDCFVKEKI